MKKIAVFVLFSMVSFISVAEESKYSIVAGLSYDLLTVSESEGDTDSEGVLVPRIGVELMMSRIDKLSFGWRTFSETYDPSNDGIGLKIDVNQFDVTWLRNLRLSREIKPWIGGGLRTTIGEIKDRHTIDNDGFLDELYDDRDAGDVSLILQGQLVFDLKDNWGIVTGITYDIPLSEGVQGISFGAGAKYDF